MPKDSLFPDDEPRGFQVWHKQGKHYEHVATVESNALGAIVMTTHGFMGYGRWPDNPAVSAMPGEHRSTTIGDVLIGPDGRSLQIAADDGLHLRPIAPVDRIAADREGAPEEYQPSARAAAPTAEPTHRPAPPLGDADIRVLPGKDNPQYRGEDSFDIHDAKGKIGHLAGYLGGPWSDSEFRVTHVEISEPGRSLTPGQWKGVLRGLAEQLPDAEYLGGNRTGEGGDLSPAYEKLVSLPPPEAAGPAPSPADLAGRAGSNHVKQPGVHHHKPKL